MSPDSTLFHVPLPLGRRRHRVPVRDVLGHKTLAMTGRYVSRDVDPLRALTDVVSARIGAALNDRGTPAEIVSIAERKVG